MFLLPVSVTVIRSCCAGNWGRIAPAACGRRETYPCCKNLLWHWWADAACGRKVGQAAADQGYVLVSGNAAGADRTAQDACLRAGGAVISIVADRLDDKTPIPGMLYLSEDGYDQPFSAQRALSRNRLIHSLGAYTLVAQSDLGKGGTWDGTVKNLRHSWSPVFCFQDGSKAAEELEQLGAVLIGCDALTALDQLQSNLMNYIDQ